MLPAGCHRVKSDCHVSFGWAASKRISGHLGRLRGSSVISPAVYTRNRSVVLYGDLLSDDLEHHDPML